MSKCGSLEVYIKHLSVSQLFNFYPFYVHWENLKLHSNAKANITIHFSFTHFLNTAFTLDSRDGAGTHIVTSVQMLSSDSPIIRLDEGNYGISNRMVLAQQS